jgi:hypothetical protein
MYKDQQILSPAEWKMVSDQVAELSRRSAEASAHGIQAEGQREVKEKSGDKEQN